LVVVAYVAASRQQVEGTTEVAALVVLAAGLIASIGHLALSSGIIAVTVLALVEKTRLHALVAGLHDEEIRAGARFAVMAVVVLPLLPAGPFGPFGGVRPQELWALVLLFAGLSFAGYIARRAVGAGQGYAVAGLLGGLISSTSVAFSFSRASRSEQELRLPLACGVVAASSMLFPRVLLAAAILSPVLARAVAAYLIAPFAVGLLFTVVSLRRASRGGTPIEPPGNPLQFWGALQMGAIFQVVLWIVSLVREQWGASGLLASGAVLGLTDLDPLIVSMAKSVAAGVAPAVGAQAIAIGIVSNTVFKLVIAVALGRAQFRHLAAAGLSVMGIVSVASWLVLR